MKIHKEGFTALKVGVDSGLLMIADLDFFKKYNLLLSGINKENLFEIKSPKGLYVLNWSIENTWNGDITGEGEIRITSNKIIVSDPCYLIKDDKWNEFLEDHFITKKDQYRMINPFDAILINRMGGDGEYKVDFTIKKPN